MSDEHLVLSPSTPLPPTEADYEAIFTAVMETVRGRWFLAEYAKRNRNADTELILSAIDRVEALWRERGPASPERMRFDLLEMAKAIAQTRAEIAAIKPDREAKGSLSEATEELDSVVQTTERATSDILAAAEQVQEIAWALRERGADGEACDALDRRATDIYSACSLQDLTGQRTRKVVEVVRFLEQRIKSMIDIWGGAVTAPVAAVQPAVAPLHLGESDTAAHLEQRDIDRIIPAPPAVRRAPAAAGDAGAYGYAARDHEPAAHDAPAAEAGEVRAAVTEIGVAATAGGGAAQPETAATAEPAMAPVVAVIGATALALELAPLEIARQPEPAPAPEPEPEAEPASEAGPAHTDPAAVLQRILALIHVPDDGSVEVEAAGDAAPDAGPPLAEAATPATAAPDAEAGDSLVVDIVTTIATTEVAAVEARDSPGEARNPETSAAAGIAAAPSGIEDDFADDILLPLPSPVTVAQAVDEMLMKVPIRVDVAPPRAAPPIAAIAPEPDVTAEPDAAAEPIAIAAEPAASVHTAHPFVIEVAELSVAPVPLAAAEPAPVVEPEPMPVAEAVPETPPELPDAEPALEVAEAQLAPQVPEPEDGPERLFLQASATPAAVASLPAHDPTAMAPEPADEFPPSVAAAPVPSAHPIPLAAPLPEPAPVPVAAPAPAGMTRPLPPKPALPRHEALAAITALSEEDKIALFS